MSEEYWSSVVDRQFELCDRVPKEAVYVTEPERRGEESAEYVQMQLPSGEAVRFKRVWSGHRFTDNETSRLMAGMEIRIDTAYARGIIGALEWQTYKRYEYYGFSPWAPAAYNRDNAPFPQRWNNHEFTDTEEAVLRMGRKVLIICVSNRSGSTYAVHVSFTQVTDKHGEMKWGIHPHFEEFNLPASSFTKETCPFKPVFSDKMLTQAEIAHVRAGGEIPYSGISKKGTPYRCRLVLALDTTRGERWGLIPIFE